MNENWRIEKAYGGVGGMIAHLSRPAFTAFWTTGGDELADIDGFCWSDEGAGENDQIQLYGFDWTDPPPGQADFESLMKQAARAIDAWIAARL
ncbi:MAG: hypothetical protein ACU836_16015 [Gammaproteobacteria bacterium]